MQVRDLAPRAADALIRVFQRCDERLPRDPRREHALDRGAAFGQELVVALRKFYYSDVSAILLMIVVTVFVIDIGTGWVRGRLFGKDARA